MENVELQFNKYFTFRARCIAGSLEINIHQKLPTIDATINSLFLQYIIIKLMKKNYLTERRGNSYSSRETFILSLSQMQHRSWWKIRFKKYAFA